METIVRLKLVNDKLEFEPQSTGDSEVIFPMFYDLPLQMVVESPTCLCLL